MAHQDGFTGVSKMGFLLFFMTKLFARLTLPLLHKMGKIHKLSEKSLKTIEEII